MGNHIKSNKAVLKPARKQSLAAFGNREFRHGEIVFIAPDYAPVFMARPLLIGKITDVYRRTNSFELHMYNDSSVGQIGLNLRKVILKDNQQPHVTIGQYVQELLEYWIHDWDALARTLGPRNGEMAIRRMRTFRNGSPVDVSYDVVGVRWSGIQYA